MSICSSGGPAASAQRVLSAVGAGRLSPMAGQQVGAAVIGATGRGEAPGSARRSPSWAPWLRRLWPSSAQPSGRGRGVLGSRWGSGTRCSRGPLRGRAPSQTSQPRSASGSLISRWVFPIFLRISGSLMYLFFLCSGAGVYFYVFKIIYTGFGEENSAKPVCSGHHLDLEVSWACALFHCKTRMDLEDIV